MTKRILYRRDVSGVPVELERVPRSKAACLKIGDLEDGTAVLTPTEALALSDALRTFASGAMRTDEGEVPQEPAGLPRLPARWTVCSECGNALLMHESDPCKLCCEEAARAQR